MQLLSLTNARPLKIPGVKPTKEQGKSKNQDREAEVDQVDGDDKDKRGVAGSGTPPFGDDRGTRQRH